MKIKRFKIFFILSIFISFCFSLIFSYQSVKLYNSHRTRGDLSNFAQAMWNTTKGRLMQNTFNYSVHNFWSPDKQKNIPENSNIFGIHFNPILFLFVPLYFIYPNPITLLLIQSILTAFAGVIIFLTASKHIKNLYILLIIQLSFLTYFTLVSAVLSEFHAYTLSIFFGLLLIYFSQDNSWRYYVSLIFLLFVQENVPIAVFFFGLYLIFIEKNRKRGLITSLLSLIYFFTTIKIVIPYLSNYKSYIFESIYGNPLGASIFQIIGNSIKNPRLLFTTILTEKNILYIKDALLPVLPFSLFSPFMLLVGLSALTTNILSSSELLKSFLMHYEALSIPFIYYSLILGIKNLLRFKNKKLISNFIIIIIVIVTTISYLRTTRKKISLSILKENIYSDIDKELDGIIKLIPFGYSVSTQDFISGHLTQRRGLYLFPIYYKKVDYLLLSIGQSTWPLEKEPQEKIINELRLSKTHKIQYESKNFILIKKIRP